MENKQLAMAPLPGQDIHPQAASAGQAGAVAQHPAAEAGNPEMPGGMELSSSTVSSRSIPDSQEDWGEVLAAEHAYLHTQASWVAQQ